MSELTDFLLARIAEDEAVARAAAETFARGVGTPPTWTSKRQWERFDPAVSEQIRRHDPARVLAECETKRRIVERHSGHQGLGPREEWRDDCDTLRILALPYADHPDYRDKWAV